MDLSINSYYYYYYLLLLLLLLLIIIIIIQNSILRFHNLLLLTISQSYSGLYKMDQAVDLGSNYYSLLCFARFCARLTALYGLAEFYCH